MTGQAASWTMCEISSSACSVLAPSPTSATSGCSVRVTSPTSCHFELAGDHFVAETGDDRSDPLQPIGPLVRDQDAKIRQSAVRH